MDNIFWILFFLNYFMKFFWGKIFYVECLEKIVENIFVQHLVENIFFQTFFRKYFVEIIYGKYSMENIYFM